MGNNQAVDAGEYSFEIEAAAKSYARRGWPVFPLHGVKAAAVGSLICDCDKGSGCKSRGKHPRITAWRQLATTNEFVVAKWWATWPNSNIGIATGHEFGLVLDFDPRHGSDASLDALEALHGTLPPTLTTRTGSDGEHQVFEFPDGSIVVLGLPALKDSEGIDVRGEGGYRGARGKHRLDARTLSHARRPHSPSAIPGARMVMEQADPFDCGTPDSWDRCPNAGARSGRTNQPTVATHRVDRRQRGGTHPGRCYIPTRSPRAWVYLPATQPITHRPHHEPLTRRNR